ncbi:MAG: DUF2301 domain-containing membrane protein [Snowella sp.]|nr:DUF2301 domain-containing membrane protein [Snowella sp.]
MDTFSPIYQGQFGEFTITDSDRREVILYRTGLAIAALSFVAGVTLFLTNALSSFLLPILNLLFLLFSLGLGLSLWKIHIYLKPLHQALQLFLAIGSVSALFFVIYLQQPLAQLVYSYPLSLLGIGFSFAALTGIFFKEAFCFNRLETKFLTPLVPLLLLGHLFSILPVSLEKILLALWAGLFLIFVARKVIQPIPPDIGDKSVFTYLEQL